MFEISSPLLEEIDTYLESLENDKESSPIGSTPGPTTASTEVQGVSNFDSLKTLETNPKDGNAVQFIKPNIESSRQAKEKLSKLILENESSGTHISEELYNINTVKEEFKDTKFYLLDCHCGKPNLSFVPHDKKVFFIQESWQGAENGTMNEHIKPLYCFHKDIEPRVFSIGNNCYEAKSIQEIDGWYEQQVDENYKNAIIHRLLSVLEHRHKDLTEACIMINTGHSYPIGDVLLDLGLNVINLQRTQPDYGKFESLRHKSCESFLI